MSCILYYSNYCNPSKKILYDLGRTPLKDEIHFVCIDQRERGEENTINIRLPNGQKTFVAPNSCKSSSIIIIISRKSHFIWK